MVGQIILIIIYSILSIFPLKAWAFGHESHSNGFPGEVSDQYEHVSHRLRDLEKDIDYIKERLTPEPVGMTVCGSSELFADGDFTASGQVGAGGTAGRGVELLGNEIKGEFKGDVGAEHSTGVGGGTHASFEVCVDLNQLAAIIKKKQAAGEPLTDLETFALQLYQNSDSVETRLLQEAQNRLNATALISSDDSKNTLKALGDQIDYLDQNLSDATLLPIRIQMVASSGVLVPLPNNLQTRLTQPWGVVPTVQDLTQSCSTIDAVMNVDVCGQIQNLGGLSLADLNNTINTLQSTVNTVSNVVVNGFNQTQQSVNQGVNQTTGAIVAASNDVKGTVTSATSGIDNLLNDIKSAVSGLTGGLFGSGGSSGGGGSGGSGGLVGAICSFFGASC